jgi:branched-chain amino acid transport system substrate-binding protein
MAVATAPALASWASPGTNEATLRVGALFPVSGTNALWVKNPGTECRSPLTCANAASGVAGKQIELVFADVNTVTSEARS